MHTYIAQLFTGTHRNDAESQGNMSLESDVVVNAAKFNRANIDEETRAFNEKLIKIWADGPRWYEVRNLCLPIMYPFVT